jgi:hypothetical protein
MASSSPKSQRIKHKLFHGLFAPIRGYTSAGQEQFYPPDLFPHSGNVLVFGDKTRMNRLVEIDNLQWRIVLGINSCRSRVPAKRCL